MLGIYTLRIGAVGMIIFLSACTAAGDIRPYPSLLPLNIPKLEPNQPKAGTIYASGQELNLYGDRRAHNVGDLLTVHLIENTAAKTSANTSASKKAEISMSAPKIFGGPVTWHGRPISETSVSSGHDFSGKGNSAQSNHLQGSVTVTVIQRLPNGNLVVQGQKNLRLNRGNELVQFQGIVRQADINPDNTVSSNRVAEAQMVYGGRGELAQSNAMGWLSRFFNSALSPF